MAGRKRKLGARYPNGELKPVLGNEPVVPAIWQRIRTEAVKLSGDARLASEIGRLSFHRELTDLQTSVALRIRDIYQNFEASRQVSRHARSPNYESGLRGGGQDDELVKLEDLDRLADGDPLRKRMLAALAARDVFSALQTEMHALTLPQQQVIERLCVDDRALTTQDLMLARELLDYFAKRFKSAKSRSKAKAAERRTKLLQAQPKPATAAAPVTAPERPVDEIAFKSLLKSLRPDLDEDGARNAHQLLVVLRDREIERRRHKKNGRPGGHPERP